MDKMQSQIDSLQGSAAALLYFPRSLRFLMITPHVRFLTVFVCASEIRANNSQSGCDDQLAYAVLRLRSTTLFL